MTIPNNREQAMGLLQTVNDLAGQYIAMDNLVGDRDSDKGSVRVKHRGDSTSINVNLKYDPLPDRMNQLREMSFTYKHSHGKETMEYKRLPDSDTQMIHTKSTSEGTEVSAVIDESKGIYTYEERQI